MSINLNQLTSQMKTALSSVEFDKVKTDMSDAADKLNAQESTLAKETGKAIEGLDVLTAELGEKGVALLDEASPVIDKLTTEISSVDVSSLRSIIGDTGAELSNAFNTVAVGSPSAEGLKTTLNQAAANLSNVISDAEMTSTLEKIVESEFVSDMSDIATKLTPDLISGVDDVVAGFEKQLSGFLSGGTSLAGDISAGLNDALAAFPAVGQIAGTFSLSPVQNFINTLDPTQPLAFANLGVGGGLALTVTDFLQNNQFDLALDAVSKLPTNIGLDTGDILTKLNAIPIDLGAQISNLESLAANFKLDAPVLNLKDPSSTITQFGDAVRQIDPDGTQTVTTTGLEASTDTAVSKSQTKLALPPLISSREELRHIMSGTQREITEMVVYQRFINKSIAKNYDVREEQKRQDDVFFDIDQRTAHGPLSNQIGKPTMHLYILSNGSIRRGSSFERPIELGQREGQQFALKVMMFTPVTLPSSLKYYSGLDIAFKANEQGAIGDPKQQKALDEIVMTFKTVFPHGRLFSASVQGEESAGLGPGQGDGGEEGIMEGATTIQFDQLIEKLQTKHNILNVGTHSKIISKTELATETERLITGAVAGAQ